MDDPEGISILEFLKYDKKKLPKKKKQNHFGYIEEKQHLNFSDHPVLNAKCDECSPHL